MLAMIAYSVGNCEQESSAIYASAFLGQDDLVLDTKLTPPRELRYSKVEPRSASANLFQIVCKQEANSGSDKDSRPAGITSGTGFSVSKDGHWLTNEHVVRSCKAISVRLPNRAFVSGSVFAADAKNDLAIVKTAPSATDVAEFRDVAIGVGEAVYAFGFPLAPDLASAGAFTGGIVNAVAGLGDDTRHLQMSAQIQEGNSGGPLLDGNGLLAGVVVSKLSAMFTLKTTGDIPQNVNFAIKQSVAREFLDSHGIQARVASSKVSIQPSQIAERARSMSALVICER
jgi:S1-C subfamily serine protease